jgi:hypothetical protein
MNVIKPTISQLKFDQNTEKKNPIGIKFTNDKTEQARSTQPFSSFSYYAAAEKSLAQNEKTQTPKTLGKSPLEVLWTSANTTNTESSDYKVQITSPNNDQGVDSNDAINSSHSLTSSGTPNFIQEGFTGENLGFSGIPNDGKSDPLYDASKYTQEENQKISNMMTIVNSSSAAEVSNANSLTGEYFTNEFSKGILEGKSLQDVIKSLDGANLRGSQTSVAYNTENMSKDEISLSNKANGTAIILRGSDEGVREFMKIDEENLKRAYKAMGFDVKVVHSEKEFEKALLSARDKAINDKKEGKESVLATHVISHGLKAGGTQGADAYSALAMNGGGLYHEKDVIGDIAGALEPGEYSESPFKHSYNAFTACHSGGFDNEQTLVHNSKKLDKEQTTKS